MRILTLLLAPIVAFAAPQPGDPGTSEHVRAADLVKKLGHPRFPVREAAAKDLLDMGGLAVTALREGLKSEDEEVRARSTALLPKAIALDWQRRSDLYLADAAGKQKHDLPLLGEYEKFVGKTDGGFRKLYAAMVRTNGPLLAAGAADKKAGAKAVADRSRILFETHFAGDKRVKMDPAEVAAVLFVQSVTGVPADLGRGSHNPGILLANPGFAEAVADKDAGPPLRKLLVRWAETLPATNTIARRSFCLAARTFSIPEAVPEFIKYAKDAKADALSVRALAVEALGKAGGPDATAALESLLTDKTEVINFGGGMDNYRLGDMALAALLTMHKKNLSDYGLKNQIGIGFDFGDGGEPINLSLQGFGTDDDRKKGMQKWKDEAAKKK